MKYLKTYPEKCVGCRACEEACSTMFFKENNREKSCIRITEIENKYQISVCTQCGECIPMCQPEAITKNSLGIVTINKKDCVGCLICVAECPLRVMHYHQNQQAPFKCIACGACAKKCPAGALEIIMEV